MTSSPAASPSHFSLVVCTNKSTTFFVLCIYIRICLYFHFVLDIILHLFVVFYCTIVRLSLSSLKATWLDLTCFAEFVITCLHLLQPLKSVIIVLISRFKSAIPSLALSMHLFGCLPAFLNDAQLAVNGTRSSTIADNPRAASSNALSIDYCCSISSIVTAWCFAYCGHCAVERHLSVRLLCFSIV